MDIGADGRQNAECSQPFLDVEVTRGPIQPKVAVGFMNVCGIAIEQMNQRAERTIVNRNHENEQATRFEERSDVRRYVFEIPNMFNYIE